MARYERWIHSIGLHYDHLIKIVHLATLSPAFTGAKMRQMFDLVAECSEQMAQTLSTMAIASGKVDCEMKDVFSKYTNDVTICI